jgi:hypothetical protein
VKVLFDTSKLQLALPLPARSTPMRLPVKVEFCTITCCWLLSVKEVSRPLPALPVNSELPAIVKFTTAVPEPITVMPLLPNPPLVGPTVVFERVSSVNVPLEGVMRMLS